jgi:hypothetical protein
MGGSKFHAVLFVALVLFAVEVAPASGPCRLCSKPVTSPSQSTDGDRIEVAIETNLDFGQLILAGEGQGAALVRPDGSNGSEGALAGVSARAMVGTASVHGLPGRAIKVELPRRIDLYSLSGGRISLDQVVSDLPSLPRLDAAGDLTFRFGGRVTVTGDSEGDYRGDMPITVEYQ